MIFECRDCPDSASVGLVCLRFRREMQNWTASSEINCVWIENDVFFLQFGAFLNSNCHWHN